MKSAALEKRKELGVRHTLCEQLQSIGVDAQMVQGAQAQKDTGFIRQSFRFKKFDDWFESVLEPSGGFIQIRGSPIRWATTLTERIEYSLHGGDLGQRMRKEYSYMVYVVPDVGNRFSNKGGSEIVGVRRRIIPFIGPFRLRWKGKFIDKVINRLNVDGLLRQEMIKTKVSVKIRGYDVDWAILSRFSTSYRSQPSKHEWYCYEKIASHLSEISR